MTALTSNNIKSGISEKSLWKTIWEWTKPDKQLFIILNILIIVNVIVALIGPIYFQNALNLLETESYSNSISQPAMRYSIIYSGTILLLFFIQFLQKITISRLNSRIINRIRVDAYNKIMSNNMSFFDESESAKLLSRLVNDSNELLDSGSRFAQAFSQLFILIGVLSVMFYYNVFLALAALIITPFIFVSAILMRNYQRRASKHWRKNISIVNNQFQEIMSSITITKSFGREENNLSQFKSINEQTYSASKKRGMVIFAGGPISDFFRSMGLIILLYASSLQIRDGASIAMIYFFILLQIYLYDPISTIARTYSQFQSSFAAMERILAIMSNSDTSEYSKGRLFEKIKGMVTFNQVSFGYSPDNPVLHSIDLKINPGEMVAIVGVTGSGKTTLVSLLMRFYSPQSGQITVDDIDIQDFDLYSLRKNIGYVSQDVILFNDTIRENLKLVRTEIDDEELWNILELVQAKEFIVALPQGLDTIVKEDGKNLSKGEKQMISLARAILADPRILILDEFTSSLDLYTESKIQRAISTVLQNRTSIIIAHRLTTILNADRIYVIDQGRIVESGNHEELLEIKGSYAKIYDKYFSFQLGSLKPKIKSKN